MERPLAQAPPDVLAASLDDKINNLVAPVANKIADTVFYSVTIGGAELPLIVVWLIIAAFFFTFYLGFINVRGFKHAIQIVKGDYDAPRGAGEVSHFQALATAVSGTVGLGNIAGVAVAVALGGPGATFWMILAGFLGMSTKFVECTLGVKYRKERPDGTVSGGPMYYLKEGLAGRGVGWLGKPLAVFFAICAVFGSLGGGNMFQANQATVQMTAVTGGDDGLLGGSGAIFGVVLALAVALVIIGGIRSIARVTVKLVPVMAVIYIVAALVIIGANIGQVPAAFGSIITGAFSPEGVAGGAVGALIVGFQRAAFSNEAGLGSAPIAHSAVKTEEPVTQGFVALLEPFVDTIVVCTLTALVLIITGTATNPDADGVALTSNAFETVLPGFDIVLAIAVVLFAYSTMLAWSYYGVKAWTYLFGESRVSEIIYKTIFCLAAVVGAAATLDPIIAFSDAMIFAMSLSNLLGLYFLAPVVKREVQKYTARLRSGEITKVDKTASQETTSV
jgi:alanine or glycine:cation symporter, AGCS family